LIWFKKSKKQTEEIAESQTDDREYETDINEIPEAPDNQPQMATKPGEDDAIPKKGGVFTRLKKGLSKTRDFFTTDIDNLFAGHPNLDDDFYDDLEELLITADIGVQTVMDIMARLTKKSGIKDARQFKNALKEELLSLIPESPSSSEIVSSRPHVVMVIGVNGVGKTTTIGKLAARAHQEGKKVLIAAADTFRAAAIEQLSIWAERANADIVKHKDNADPAAVAFDGISAAVARNADIVFIDTAGRLHTKVNLMEELKKIKRSIGKVRPDAPHEVLLVLDATTGQNALSQAELFHEAIGVTGIALTKLDGTAKGGIVISICHSHNIPLKYIGVGEAIEDLQDFDPKQFVDALF
jgi:fused signal recognition particle receptor